MIIGGRPKTSKLKYGDLESLEDVNVQLTKLSATIVEVEKRAHKSFLQGTLLPDLFPWIEDAKLLEKQAWQVLQTSQQNNQSLKLKLVYFAHNSPLNGNIPEFRRSSPSLLKKWKKFPVTHGPKVKTTASKPESEVKELNEAELVNPQRKGNTNPTPEQESILGKLPVQYRNEIEVGMIDTAQPNQTAILPLPGRVETAVEEVPDAAETSRGSDLPFSVSLSVRGKWPEQVELKFESLYGISSRNKPPENSEFKSCGFTSDADDYRILMREKNMDSEADHEKAIYFGWRLTRAPEEVKWRHASVMMLMDNAFTSLPSQPNSPNIVILFLQRNERLRKIPDSFFRLMRSVTFLDISGTRIRSLPSSLFGLDQLQVLRMRDSKCLDRLPTEIGLMKGLEVLDLFGTELYNMPDDIGNLSQLRQLLLTFYGNDDESEIHDPSFLISPCIISRLSSLEELGIRVYPEDKRWLRNVDSLIIDLANLNTLSRLDFYFPEVELLDLFIRMGNPWKNIRPMKFKFVVGKNVKRIVDRVPPEVEIKFNEHIRSLRFVNGEDVHEAVKQVAEYATALYLDHHLTIRSLSEMGTTMSKQLVFCTLRECPNLERIIDDGEMVQPAYPRLEYLGIHYIWKLESIFGTSLLKGSFSCLTSLVVATCPVLEFILSESMVQCLCNLEELAVVNCMQVGAIIKEIDEKQVQTIVKIKAPVFPRLAKLQLQHLPQLHSFWWKLGGESKDQFPSGSFTDLHSAEVRSCPQLDLVLLNSMMKDVKIVDHGRTEQNEVHPREKKKNMNEFVTLHPLEKETDLYKMQIARNMEIKYLGLRDKHGLSLNELLD